VSEQNEKEILSPQFKEKNSQNQIKPNEISRERREQAFAKLLEGQSYIWKLKNQRSKIDPKEAARLGKLALRKAVELNPNLDEAYTALSEIGWLNWTLGAADADLSEAEIFAGSAVKINPNS